MAKRVVKKIPDLPKWFLENEYKTIDDPISWAVEIKLRLSLRPAIEHFKKGGISADFFEEAFNNFSKTAALNINDCYNENNQVLSVPEILTPFTLKPPIDSLDVWDVAHMASALPQSVFKKISDIRALIDMDSEQWKDRNRKIESREYCVARDKLIKELEGEPILSCTIDDVLKMTSSPYKTLAPFVSRDVCSVDISQDNETLISEFEKWLKYQRNLKGVEVKGKKTPLTKETFLDWNRYKPLQVHDIDLWCEITGLRITDATLARYLWPDDDPNAESIDPVNRLRQVTRKSTVPTIISNDMFDRLMGIIDTSTPFVKMWE